ncbi:MAG: D-alanyl-D-alanine carboxypeptidase family protein, partial [Syntrophomonadaceae bacterium]
MYQRKCLLSVFLAIFFFVNLLPVYAANQNLPATGTYPQTLAKAAVLMDASSGRVLYESNAHQRLSPASVTKIMTALLVAEQGNLEQKVTISQNAADTPESSVWLEPGEKLTRRQLLYACMLNSANDAAVALAESVAGSEQDFVQLMNRRARQLGMKDSHFGNPHGLETAGHYTSAYDLALLSREALTNKIFRQVVATQSTKIPWTGKEYDRLLVNQNRLLYRYDGAIGVKTGYTKQAGNCVVGAAQRGSLVLIAV